MTFQFHPEARREYLEAAAFYESRREGLGAAFTVEVEATIQRLLEVPECWPVLDDNIRVCRTRAFPYGVLYCIENDAVLIVAVMHLHREPGYWRQRTESGKPPQE